MLTSSPQAIEWKAREKEGFWRKKQEMDYFAVLGLDPGADEEAVKKAYKSLAKRWKL